MSEVPPPYPQYQQKKSNTVLIVVLVLAGAALLCVIGVAALGFWGFNVARQGIGPIIGCSFAFEEVNDGLKAYVDANGGKLPNAQTWQDDIRSYVVKAAQDNSRARKEAEIFAKDYYQDANGDWGCTIKKDGPKTGIAFNSEFSGKLLSELPAESVLLFEIEAARANANEAFTELPKSSSPTFMGENRGWFTVTADGVVRLDNQRFEDSDFSGEGSGNVRIRTE